MIITILLITNVLTLAYAFSKSLEATSSNTRLSRALGESGRVDWSGIYMK